MMRISAEKCREVQRNAEKCRKRQKTADAGCGMRDTRSGMRKSGCGIRDAIDRNREEIR